MKVIIAGSRGITDIEVVRQALNDAGFEVSEIISGMCPDSPDMAGVEIANQLEVPLIPMPAQWIDPDAIRDRSAGRRRNTEMARYATALVAVWDGYSPGTKHMIGVARRRGLKVHVHKVAT